MLKQITSTKSGLRAHALAATFRNDERGATAIEYGLIASIIAIGIIASLVAVGGRLQDVFQAIVNAWPF